jgi:hypothetical protein
MDGRQKEGSRELEKSGYLRQVREFAMARCVPFFWRGQEAGQPPRLLHNGPIFYVDTGQCQIGITNNHVYQQYIDDLANFPGVEARFNGTPTHRPVCEGVAEPRRIPLHRDRAVDGPEAPDVDQIQAPALLGVGRVVETDLVWL